MGILGYGLGRTSFYSWNSKLPGLLHGEASATIGPVVGKLVDAPFGDLKCGERRALRAFVNAQTPQNINTKLPILVWKQGSPHPCQNFHHMEDINAVADTAIVENRYGGGVEVVSPMTAISETNILRAKAIHYNPGGFLRAAFKVDHLASYHRLG